MLAGHAELSPDQLRQPLAEVKAEPGPLETARCRRIELLERLKEAMLVFGLDSDSSVNNADGYAWTIVPERIGYIDPNRSSERILDRVAGQVE